MLYTMMQVCKETNMTYQALKFYCNEGLVPHVKRDRNNRRVFDERDVAWIKSLTCLKKCNMSIQEMKEYLRLCLQGEATIPQRKELLARKQAELRQTMRDLQDSIAYIDRKQNFYDEVLSGKRPYESNLIRVENRRKAGVSIKSRRRTAWYRLLLAFLPYFIPAPRPAPSSG